ncbi:S9 family peptidase [Chloroflexota bacterium]
MIDSQMFDLEALLRIPYVEPDLGFDISPDGKWAAFSWNKTGRWEIFILKLAGSISTDPVQVSVGEGAKFAPRWSPDGQRLAYVVDLDGGEYYDLWVYEIESKENLNLTPNSPDALSSSFSWSPDGEWIAFCCNRDGRFDTYCMPSEGGPWKKILDYDHPDWEAHWSPDGNWIAVVAEGGWQDYWTYIVSRDGEDVFPVILNGKQICAKDASWSPDSRYLAFSSNHDGNYQIGLWELRHRAIKWLTSGEGEKEQPAWSPDSHRIAYVESRGPSYQLVIHTVGEVEDQKFQIEPGVIYKPIFTPDGQNAIFVFNNPRHPDDLWSFSIEDGEFSRLTNSMPEDIEIPKFTMPKEVFYSGLDEAQVPGLLYHSGNSEPKPPAVLYVHGGPNWLTQITWDPLVQHMASRGWVVLAPNYRGSTGYGRDWQLASRFDLGGVDTADVAAGADYLVSEGLADSKRIAVTGRSWGGYLTMTCLTQYPEKWAAGSAVVPFLNWFTAHENSREDLQHWDLENFGDPKENYDLWYERSPFFFLDQIAAPVQLICGVHDVRCPASESKQAHEALIAIGRICEYVLYADEGHSFLKIENQVDVKKRRVEFLRTFLENNED